jgi:mannose-6-phosphate isomerase-like protein (cupin superfamily)
VNRAVVHAPSGDDGERLVVGGVTILVRLSSEASGGAFSLFEEVSPLADTPLHMHRDEDELFYVLEGEHVFRVGDDEFRVGPGGFVFAPRGVPHSQKRVMPGVGRELILTTPGVSRGSSESWPQLRTPGPSAQMLMPLRRSGSGSPG